MPSSDTLLLIFLEFDWIIHPLPAMLLILVFLKHYTERWGYSIGIASVLFFAVPHRICSSKFSWKTLLNPRVRDAPRNMRKPRRALLLCTGSQLCGLGIIKRNIREKLVGFRYFSFNPCVNTRNFRISYFRYLIINFKLCSLV